MISLRFVSTAAAPINSAPWQQQELRVSLQGAVKYLTETRKRRGLVTFSKTDILIWSHWSQTMRASLVRFIKSWNSVFAIFIYFWCCLIFVCIAVRRPGKGWRWSVRIKLSPRHHHRPHTCQPANTSYTADTAAQTAVLTWSQQRRSLQRTASRPLQNMAGPA